MSPNIIGHDTDTDSRVEGKSVTPVVNEMSSDSLLVRLCILDRLAVGIRMTN